MSKKKKWITVSVIFAIVAILFASTAFQRQYRNVLLEMIIYPPMAAFFGGGYRVYRFVVLNNGTLISYSGIRVDDSRMIERFDTIMWPVVRRRSRTRLSDEDFQNISEMIFILSEGQAIPLGTRSQWRMMLLHDENIYRGGFLEFHKIADELLRLSPLANHHPLLHPDFIEELLREFGN